MRVPASMSERSLTFYVKGNPYSIDRNSPAWAELKELIQQDDPDIERMIALTQPVRAVSIAVEDAVAADYLPKGVVAVTREAVTYNGVPLKGVLVDRIFDMLSEGFDIMPMIRFVENLMQNPNDFARDELYLWLETSDMPITTDGHFLAYKNVRHDFKSIHGGKVDNTPGTTVQMPRQSVDKNRNNTCSTGLHFCSKSYLPNFSHAANGKTILLKINPADVVSIPSDYGNAKGRAWKYLVLEEVGFNIGERSWPAVYADDSDEEVEVNVELLQFPSELSKTLFAAIGESSGVDESNRHEWASEILDKDIESFHELTVDDASRLLQALRDVKAAEDAGSESAAVQALTAAERRRVDTINGYGIVTLRAKASDAGYRKETGRDPWKDAKAADLRAFLVAKGLV